MDQFDEETEFPSYNILGSVAKAKAYIEVHRIYPVNYPYFTTRDGLYGQRNQF